MLDSETPTKIIKWYEQYENVSSNKWLIWANDENQVVCPLIPPPSLLRANGWAISKIYKRWNDLVNPRASGIIPNGMLINN